MIKRLRYHEIDFEKYQHCLENSCQRNFYVQKEILDFLCEGWELLVYRDYEAVMPVPVKNKWKITFVVAPIFCQQLGVFSKDDNKQINTAFYDYLSRNYLIISYPFNYKNSFDIEVLCKKNYIIPKRDYSELKRNYMKGRKAVLPKSIKLLDYRVLSNDDNRTDFIKLHFKGLQKTTDLNGFIDFMEFLEYKNSLNVYESSYQSKTASLAVVAHHNDQMILMALINDKSLQEFNGASMLVDQILQDHIAEKDFDFMGGNIRGIELFFKSFGAKLQEFAVIENTKKTLIKNFLNL
ncbi:hypothetical protein FNJ88_00360 [Chryseobacterium sp. SNU WT5]|uniref:hypothetical protein n=1 Tax=Chryseobacterium sp. SNU WT5 TaxID=2594269 RepID=UPI00118051F9|nr:hypothetical protein [Chryseobacterium sp. SNU WT5]QDP84078.1 hypothetical protein FNJ88_00360 [Chryseobacterium sp. SNU WT5]